MAKYSKKRARSLHLKEDRFRDTAMKLFDRLGNLLEGKGRVILYGLAGVVAIALLIGLYSYWSNKKSDEETQALGRAIDISTAQVQPSPVPGSTQLTFPTERERATSAIAEFQKVANKYSGRTREMARYFIAANQLQLDAEQRARGISELEQLTKSSYPDIAAQAKFALAQARESDGQLDQAAALYKELAQQANAVVPTDTVNLRLASLYEKQNKKQEAVDLYFAIADAARKAKAPDGKPLPKSSAARDAEQKLQKLDSARYAQLPPEAPSDLPL